MMQTAFLVTCRSRSANFVGSRSLSSSSSVRPFRQRRKVLLARNHKPRAAGKKRQKATLSIGSNPPATAVPAAAANTAARQESRRSVRDIIEQSLSKPRTLPIPRWMSPRHSTMTIAECFGHGSFVLVAASYAVDDFLMLRMIAVTGSTAMLVFTYFHPHGRILWLPFKWNLLFIAINSYRIGKVYLDRYRAERLAPELMELRNNNFYLMDPVDFARLVSIAKIEEYKKGETLVSQNESNRYVRCVVGGELRVLRDGQLTYVLEDANFVSEAGLHAGLLLPGAIESCCTIQASSSRVRLLTWDRTQLMELMERYPGLRRTFKGTLSWDVIRKLKAQRTLLAEGLIDNPEEWTERRTRQTNHRYAAILKTVLQQHPEYLASCHNSLHKYRMIHHIDDIHHAEALKEAGWTPEELEKEATKSRSGPRAGWCGQHPMGWHVSNMLNRVFG